MINPSNEAGGPGTAFAAPKPPTSGEYVWKGTERKSYHAGREMSMLSVKRVTKETKKKTVAHCARFLVRLIHTDRGRSKEFVDGIRGRDS